jgi:hypothetical protein
MVFVALFLVGCSDTLGPGSETQLTLAFTVGSSAAQASAAHPAPRRAPAAAGLEIVGSNGVLTITDVRLILAEFELEAISGSCASGDESECHEFEAPPSFLQLPLEGDVVTVATTDVPPGSYDELEFEVEDLEDDEADDDFAAAEVLRALIRVEFPEWPDKASMLVVGTFDPTGDDPIIPFKVFVDAEIEIEIDLMPILVISSDGGASRTITVDVQPDIWFELPNGGVLDLSQFDWDTTGELLEFEFEFEDGFAEIEFD